MREQREVLEHHREVAPERRYRRDALVADEDLALVRLLEACNESEGGGLAASGRTEQREEHPARDRERQRAHRRGAAIALGDALEADIGLRIGGLSHASTRWHGFRRGAPTPRSREAQARARAGARPAGVPADRSTRRRHV